MYGSDTLGFLPGRFAFTTTQRAKAATGLVSESAAVMQGLREILPRLGARFGDVVRMNNRYQASGTKDEWEPSARAVTRYQVDPEPIATAMSLPDGRAIQIEHMAMPEEDGSPLPKQHSWPRNHWDRPIHLPYKHGLPCGELAFVGGQVALHD